MEENDPKLSALLKQWRGIEPSANFEANVRRRIRLAAPEPPRPSWLLWRPAFSVAVAALIAVAIGTWSGAHSASRPESAGFLAHDTLTGRYLGLTTGGQP